MDSLTHNVLDFRSLESFIQGKTGNFNEKIKEYFYQLGKDLGFESHKDFTVKQDRINFGKIDVAWFDGDEAIAGFSIEFASKENFLASIWRLIEFNPQNSFLLTSSNAKIFSLEEARSILTTTHIKKPPIQSFTVIDLAKEKFIRVK